MKTKIITILAASVILLGVCPVQGGVWWVDGYIEINEGDVYDGELFIIDHGSVDMFGGIVGKLETWDWSTANIFGGEIDWLWTDDNTVVNIYGGSLNILASRPDSRVYLYAYDVTYHPDGGLYNQPWLEGKYISDNNPFSFSFYGDSDYPQLTIVPEPLVAEIDIKPTTLNLASTGRWITCHIWLPEDYNITDVNTATVYLEHRVQPEWIWFNEKQNVVMTKFNHSEIQNILEPGEVELTVSGHFLDGTYFLGTDTIKVINKGRKDN